MSRPVDPAKWHLPFDHFKLQFRNTTRWTDGAFCSVYPTTDDAEQHGRALDQDDIWNAGEIRMMPCDKYGNHAKGAKPLPAPPQFKERRL